MDSFAFWKGAPFVRLVFALSSGIIAQWYLQFSSLYLLPAIISLALLLVVYSFLSTNVKFRLRILSGIMIHLIVVLCGALLLWYHDIRNNRHWIGHGGEANAWIMTLEEPLTGKPASWKSMASVNFSVQGKKLIPSAGRVLIYFQKDSSLLYLAPGSQIICGKSLQEIRSSGNPGGFDFKRYALFNGITHQVYLTANDFMLLSKSPAPVKNFIWESRKAIVNILRRYISGSKEAGLAEALLIGYKDDLDKDLVQAYAVTGVVHVIAISGLHLGLIYALLLLLTKPVKKIKHAASIRFFIIVTSLWIFSFIAGAQPSVLRSAVMFSFIALGETMERRGSIFNTLALSAFVLLCYHPSWLWDAGFQLSYSAVTGIMLFFKPLYNLFYCANKLADAIWKANAVTLSAQLLTLPVSLYHFHQFPLLFLFSNLVAVPLSGIILFGTILLCCLAFLPPAAKLCALLVEPCIRLMNQHVEALAHLPFAGWKGLLLSPAQSFLLMLFLLAGGYWLMEKSRTALRIALGSFFLISLIRCWSFHEKENQRSFIVYNLPGTSAIQWIEGRSSVLFQNNATLAGQLYRFHLEPSAIIHRLRSVQTLPYKTGLFTWRDKKICIINSAVSNIPKQPTDILVLSGKLKLNLPALIEKLSPGIVVVDGSVPAWRSSKYLEECSAHNIPFYDTKEKGAFVVNP
jgi:competence protein ComEC